MRPDLSRVPEYYHKYIAQVKGDDLLPVLKKQGKGFARYLEELPKSKRHYKYGPDKWTIIEVVQHILDAERVFAYRALCIARGEQQPLPGFDENTYAEHANKNKRKWKDIVEEFIVVRRSTEILFASLSEENLDATGTASNWPVYVNGIGFLLAGHLQHHWNILQERYV